MKIKFLIVFVLSVFCLSLTSCNLTFLQDFLDKDIEWRIENDTFYLSGSGDMVDRKSFKKYPWAKEYISNITRIEIEEGITSIGAYAFEEFSQLRSISLPNSITYIGDYAFADSAFYSIDLPNYIQHIGNGAFADSALKRISIPRTVQFVGDEAFGFRYSPHTVCYEGSVDEWEMIEIGENPEIDESVFYFNSQDTRKRNYAPLNIQGNACGDNATWSVEDDKLIISGSGDIWDFYDDEETPWNSYTLREVEISEEITGIGDYALSDAGIIVKIPEKVTFIGDEALNEDVIVLIPEAVKQIGSENFSLNPSYIFYTGSESSWKNIAISKDNSRLEDYDILFDYKPQYFYARPYDAAPDKIPDGYCGDNATWGYEDGILTIKGNGQMWDGCSPWADLEIDNLIIEEGITGIGNGAFYNCRVKNVSIPDTILYIGDKAFHWTLLNQVDIPDSVKYIGEYAFYDKFSGGSSHDAVREVYIPDSVVFIASNAFSSEDVNSFTVDENNPVFLSFENVLFNKDMTHLYCYYYSSNQSTYNIPSGVRTIGRDAFKGHWAKLKKITIPNTVTKIGSSAFSNCQHITDFKLPYGLETISSAAFGGCMRITEMDIPDSVTYIGAGAFSNCIRLEDVTIPEGITEICDNTFWACAELRSVSIPEGVTTIRTSAFEKCESLDTIRLPSTLRKVEWEAFNETSVDFAYYSGDDSQWSLVEIGYGNEVLQKSVIFNN